MQPVRTTKARPGSPSTRLTADSEVRVESQARSNQTAAEEQVLGADSGDWQGFAESSTEGRRDCKMRQGRRIGGPLR
jgi:hypothetical protein